MIPDIEKQALVALYNSTDGDNWTDNSGWLTDADPCTWYGVSCAEGRVVRIALKENGLTGSLPPEIGNLSNLITLNLSNNQISSIPPEMGNLSLLEELKLDHNQITGQVPASILNNLSSLYIIHLNRNQFSGALPPELFDHSPCYDLFLHQNQISGPIPPEIGDFACAYFNLSGNRLSGAIPPEIGGAHFDVLDLSNNALSGEIPTTITNLNLECQYLGGIHQYWICYDSLFIDFNMLSSSDSDVIAYLDKYDGVDRGWSETQTIPPTGLSVVDVNPNSVKLSWSPIQYTGDGGYYEIGVATTPGGPYTVHGQTSDKTFSSYVVDGLETAQDYYFAVRTFTPAHDDQQNDLLSEYSDEIKGTPRAFLDVHTDHWAYDFVGVIYNAGLTSGCSTEPLMYCPDDTVTRAQIPVFLENGIHYPDWYSPPDVDPSFGDTAGHWAEDWIEALYTATESPPAAAQIPCSTAPTAAPPGPKWPSSCSRASIVGAIPRPM